MTVYVCLGETDEAHPFCPFATRDLATANEHEKHQGHWCRRFPREDDLGRMWAESLRIEDSRALPRTQQDQEANNG